MSYQRFLVLIGIVLLSLSVQGQTLIEAVSSTLKTNPDIQVSRYNVEAADQLSQTGTKRLLSRNRLGDCQWQ